MRYEFENGEYATFKAGDFWTTLTIYNKDGEVLEEQTSENIFTLLDYLRDKVKKE